MRNCAHVAVIFCVFVITALSPWTAGADIFDVTPGSHVVERGGVPIAGSPFATDTAAIQAAIDTAGDGDSIHLRSGVYLLGDPKTTTFDVELYPGETSLPGERIVNNVGSSLLAAQNIAVHKALRVFGDVDAAGRPTTILTTAQSYDPATNAGDETRFITWKSRVTFENLRFEGMALQFQLHAPYDLINCEADTGGPNFSVLVLIDDRTLAQFANTGSMMSGCRWNGVRQHAYAGSHQIFDSTIWEGSAARRMAPVHQPLWNPPDITAGLDRVTFDGCAWRNFEFLTFSSFGIGVSDLTIRNSIFEDGEIGLDFFNATPFQNVQILDNLFRRNGIGILLGGREAPVRDSTISGNVFEDMWTTRSPTLADASVCVGLLDAERVSILRNDYTASGQPRHEESILDSTIVLLDDSLGLGNGASSCTVFESGNFPPGQGGADNHVTDLGANNRVVGQAANRVEQPAGIGQVLREAGGNRTAAVVLQLENP